MEVARLLIQVTVDAERLDAWLSKARAGVPRALSRAVEEAADEAAEEMASSAPVATGRLRQSISKRVSGMSAEVWPTASYAAFVEYGTRPHLLGSPVLIRGVGWRFIAEHPGTRPQPFVRPAAERLRREMREILSSSVRGALS